MDELEVCDLLSRSTRTRTVLRSCVDTPFLAIINICRKPFEVVSILIGECDPKHSKQNANSKKRKKMRKRVYNAKRRLLMALGMAFTCRWIGCWNVCNSCVAATLSPDRPATCQLFDVGQRHCDALFCLIVKHNVFSCGQIHSVQFTSNWFYGNSRKPTKRRKK